MAEQPQNMEELIRSIRETKDTSIITVIPTLYGRIPEALPTQQRDIFRRALRDSMAQANGLYELQAGDAYTVARQTDVWFASQDTNGSAIFHNFVNDIALAARSRR